MGSLRIATLNCLNLALPGRRIYEGVAPFTADEYIARTQWLAGMLDRLAADVVLLQEVFHERALVDVIRQTASQGKGLSCVAPFADEVNTRPRLGIIWRAPWAPKIDSVVTLPCAPVPVAEREMHREFSRPVLRAVLPVTLGSGAIVPLTVLNVHLKSRRPEFADDEDVADRNALARAHLRALTMRAAEACGLRHLIVDILIEKSRPLIVAGDFNDGLDAVTTRIVADSFSRFDSNGLDQLSLVEATSVLPRGQMIAAQRAYSIFHHGQAERIDHIFVSDAFSPDAESPIGRVTAVEWLVDHLTERRRSCAEMLIPPVEPDLTRIYSDHAAVCATILFD